MEVEYPVFLIKVMFSIFYIRITLIVCIFFEGIESSSNESINSDRSDEPFSLTSHEPVLITKLKLDSIIRDLKLNKQDLEKDE